MLTLALDTSSPESSLAVFNDTSIIASAKHHSHKLQTGFFKVMDDVFHEHNLSPREIKKVIMGIGPGSFTGVRVGVSLAKTLSQLTNAILIPIRSYYLAMGCLEHNAYYIPAIPSTRTECYAALFKIAIDGKIQTINEVDDGGPVRISYWLNHIDDKLPIHIYGEASWMFSDIDFPTDKKIILHESSETMPDAIRAFNLLKLFPEIIVPIDPLIARPLYVRPSPAELQRIEGQRGDK